jgi:glucose-6-phosphate isomerase, archaeal
MKSLESVSGLPIAINEDNTLQFNQPVVAEKPVVRKYEDMKAVLMDQSTKPDSQDMYYMYRNVRIPDHENILKEMNVTYDITVIPPGKVGQEFNKTLGHYHAVKPGTKFAYPEVYEVMHGHALFVLQKMDEKFERLISVLVMEAKAGDKVVYPPNYGHILVNIGNDVLVTANWVGDSFERQYTQITEKHGMAYYVVAGGPSGYDFVANDNYANHPEIRFLSNQFMGRFGIMGDQPLYTLGTYNSKNLEFLTHPEKYAVELSSITS